MRPRTLAAAALALLAARPAAAQEAGLPPLRTFTPREYGAGAQNWAVAQDARGIVYVGNTSGVLEFDGLRWRLHPTPLRTSIRSLAVDAQGRVWVGAKGELGSLEPDERGQLRFLSHLEDVPEEERDFTDVWQTFAAPEGVYFSTYKRLLRLDGRAPRSWTPETAFRFAFRIGPRLFIRQVDRGLMELVDGRFQLVPGSERFGKDPISAMAPWKDGAIVLGTRSLGCFVLDGGGLRELPTGADEGLRRDLVYAAVPLDGGGLALGTLQGGLYLLDREGRWTGLLNEARGLPDDTIWAAAADREGGLWLGLDRGLARVQAASALTSFDARSGLPGTAISLHRHQGVLFVGTSQGLYRLVPGPEAHFEGVAQVKHQVWDFLSVGSALLVTSNDGVYELKGDAVTLVRKETGPAFALLPSAQAPGRVFVGLMDGLASLRRQGEAWIDEGKLAGVSGEIRTLVEAGDGRLWAGTQGTGALRLTLGADAPQVERFGTAEGLPSANHDYVYDVGGEILFATRRGLYRFDDARRRFEPDPRFAALFPDGARGVTSPRLDAQGRLWMHSWNETVSESGAAVKQPDGSYRWEGRGLAPAAGGSIETLEVDADGVVWLGGEEGLWRYDPRRERPDAPFRALVRQVGHPGGGPVLYGGSGEPALRELSWGENALRFEYAAPSFESLQATRFQVWLEGNDRGWSPWTAEGHREYTNLHEGAYRFHVRARNLKGTLSEEAVYAFRVRPPWYRTPLAWLGYLLGALGLAWGLVRWRLFRLEAEKRALEAVVVARTSELRAKNDQLETLNAIVKSVNEQLDFDALLQAMLRECRVIRGLEKAAALVRLPEGAVFTFRAALGWSPEELHGLELTAAEAEARYTRDAEQVSEDVFLIRGLAGRAGEEKLRGVATAQALLVLRIRGEERVEGYLVFENEHDREAFAQHDLELLRGLREHFVSAFAQARARRRIEVQNQDIRASIRYAGRIQQAILPAAEERARALPESFVLNLPRDVVSGDFHWMAETPEGTLLAVADCTGHGVPGALLSMLGCSLLDEVVRGQGQREPARILEQLHLRVTQSLKQSGDASAQEGMEIGLLRLGRRVDFASARCPLYVVHEGRTSRLEGDRKPVGGERGGAARTFQQSAVEVASGDWLYLCTDGLADQLDAEGRRFGGARLLELLARVAAHPAAEQAALLQSAVDAHRGGSPQVDDLTVLGVRVR